MGPRHRITKSVDNQISISSGKVTLRSTVHQGAFRKKKWYTPGVSQASEAQRLQVIGFEMAGALIVSVGG